MRQVFSSPRMENVERVAQLLREAGIETRITHGRSYKGGLHGAFSYRDQVRTDPVPAVWVVLSDDQPAARGILRGAGLLDSTRGETGYTLPAFRTELPAIADNPARKRSFRLKVGLLLVIAMVIALMFVSLRKPQEAITPTPRPANIVTLPKGDASTPDALAVAVLAGELPTRANQAICLAVDGRDPSPSLLALLPPSAGKVLPASQCGQRADVPTLEIGAYRQAASGASIVLERRRGAAVVISHTYAVRPDGNGWRVIEPYR
jgi:hypothetical protein